MRSLTAEEVKCRLPSHITLDVSTYKRTKIKARFIDSEYGEWWALPNNVLSGQGHIKRGRPNTLKGANRGLF
jgi:hypothetical protein